MNPEIIRTLQELLPQIQGYIYPKRDRDPLGLLIVVYPYITRGCRRCVHPGVAGEGLQREGGPAALPALPPHRPCVSPGRPDGAVSHLGHPGRFYEILLTRRPPRPWRCSGLSTPGT